MKHLILAFSFLLLFSCASGTEQTCTSTTPATGVTMGTCEVSGDMLTFKVLGVNVSTLNASTKVFVVLSAGSPVTAETVEVSEDRKTWVAKAPLDIEIVRYVIE